MDRNKRQHGDWYQLNIGNWWILFRLDQEHFTRRNGSWGFEQHLPGVILEQCTTCASRLNEVTKLWWYLDTETGWSLGSLTSITTIKLQWASTTRFEAPCQVQILILMMVSCLLSDISCPKPWWILQSLAMAVEPNAAACHHPNVWRCWGRLGAVPSNHDDGWLSSLMSTPE